MDNLLEEDAGVFKTDASGTVTYEMCNFTNNKRLRESGVSSLFNPSGSRVHISQCQFDGPGLVDWEAQLTCIINLDSASPLNELEISDCHFIGVRTTSPMLKDSKGVTSLSITACIFDDCDSTSLALPFFEIACQRFVLSQNELRFKSEWGGRLPVSITVTGNESKVEGTRFHLISQSSFVSNGLVGVTFEPDSELQFFNCCFTLDVERPTWSHQLMKPSGSGTLILSSVCFGVSRELAIDESAGTVIVIVDAPDIAFSEECECWVIIESPTVPESESELESEPDSPTPEPSNTDVSDLPGPTETTSSGESSSGGPDSGSGGTQNAGLIAGVVIGVLVIIAVVIVLVFILLRRRKAHHTDEATGPEEFAEEPTNTATSADELADPVGNDWSRTTEDNPVFFTEGDDQNMFGNSFEERFGTF